MKQLLLHDMTPGSLYICNPNSSAPSRKPLPLTFAHCPSHCCLANSDSKWQNHRRPGTFDVPNCLLHAARQLVRVLTPPPLEAPPSISSRKASTGDPSLPWSARFCLSARRHARLPATSPIPAPRLPPTRPAACPPSPSPAPSPQPLPHPEPQPQ